MRVNVALLSLTLLLVAGCGGPAVPPANSPAPAEPGATAPVPTSTAYDPLADHLVNPDALTAPAPDDAAAIALDETLIRNIDGNPSNLNPLFGSSAYEQYLSAVLFTGLFSFDEKMQWTVNHDIVESFEESDDHLIYMVKMKPGLSWQDGEPFTADDVCWSWQEILDERVPCPAVRNGTDQIVGCKVVDDLTLEIRHKEALPTNPWNALFPILPKHLYEKDVAKNPDLKSGDYYEKLNRAPVGSGPYRFVEWVANDKIVLERWDGYAGKKPHFKRMIFRIIPDDNTLLLTFNKGEIDEFRMSAKQFATQTLQGSDFAKVGVKCLAPQWAFSYIGWNQDGSNPFFSDVRVRQAMTYATDTKRMIRDLAYNLYEPCHGIFHPNAPWYNPEVKLMTFDLDRAGALLDEAGWKIDENHEGWRYGVVDGQPVKFEFTLLIPQGSDIARDLAAIMQEDLRGIGVDMKTQILEWATFQERTRKHEFQASTAAWGTGTDPDTLWNLWRSDQYDPQGNFGRNYGGYRNARVDELFELARHEFDFDTRRAYYQEIQQLIYDEQPYTFLWNRGTLWAFNQRIHGITTSPRGVFGFDPAEAGWWVKAAEQKYPAAKTP